MTREDWRIAAVVVLGFVLVITGTAVGASLADYVGSPRQAHALHAVSFGLLQASGMGAISVGVIAGVIALARALRVRGGVRVLGGLAPPRSGYRTSPRSIPHDRSAFDAFGQRRVVRGRKGGL
jgi:hypothetical protein